MKIKFTSLLLALIMILSLTLTACGRGGASDSGGQSGDSADGWVEEEKTEIRIAIGMNRDSSISFSENLIPSKEEGIILPNGKTYHQGDLKPLWSDTADKLSVKLSDVYSGDDWKENISAWEADKARADIIMAPLDVLAKYSASGDLLDIGYYLADLPDFVAYKNADLSYKYSSISSVSDSYRAGITALPVTDGTASIDSLPYMRADWIELLLNGESIPESESTLVMNEYSYTPYITAQESVDVRILLPSGSTSGAITKRFDAAGNIISVMNTVIEREGMSGEMALTLFRNYIDEAYGGYYGTNRADLFIGKCAAWDADELVALLRCIYLNADILLAESRPVGIAASSPENMLALAGELFGARGLNSQNGYLYIDNYRILHDARMEEDTYLALERMRMLETEGLLSFSSDDIASPNLFMYYGAAVTDEKDGYTPVLTPLAFWSDAPNYDVNSSAESTGAYIRFTESNDLTEGFGIAISKSAVINDEEKLDAVLALVNCFFTDEGRVAASYGGSAFIKKNADGEPVMAEYLGDMIYLSSDEVLADMKARGEVNFAEYSRKYLGSYIAFNVMESSQDQFAISDPDRDLGRKYVKAGVVVTTKYANDTPWFSPVPSQLPLSKSELAAISECGDMFSGSLFDDRKNEDSLLYITMKSGYRSMGYHSVTALMLDIAEGHGGREYLDACQAALDRLTDYFYIENPVLE